MYCNELYYTVLHSTVLYCTVLYCNVLYRGAATKIELLRSSCIRHTMRNSRRIINCGIPPILYSMQACESFLKKNSYTVQFHSMNDVLNTALYSRKKTGSRILTCVIRTCTCLCQKILQWIIGLKWKGPVGKKILRLLFSILKWL